jgi:hypothetical protein
MVGAENRMCGIYGFAGSRDKGLIAIGLPLIATGTGREEGRRLGHGKDSVT